MRTISLTVPVTVTALMAAMATTPWQFSPMQMVLKSLLYWALPRYFADFSLFGGLADVYNLATITLINVETIAFADGNAAVDTALPGANIIWGKDWWQDPDNIIGTDGDDLIDSNGGSDVIDGGAGNDTLLLFGNKDDFTITVSGDTVSILWSRLFWSDVNLF